jgi:hypothetical protein
VVFTHSKKPPVANPAGLENLPACGQFLTLNRLPSNAAQTPRVKRSFHSACDDLKPSRKQVVNPGNEAFPLDNDVQAVTPSCLCAELSASS